MNTCDQHEVLTATVGRIEDKTDRIESKMNQIDVAVTDIKESLVGTLDRQGFIGERRVASERNRRDIDELVEWRMEMSGAMRALTIKLLSGVAATVTIGAVVAIAVVKWIVG